ncbi:MAG: hypothetical protein J6S13_00420 [Clostridia bacterium]|nr:hypothetical protein [Clostridia bacterium]
MKRREFETPSGAFNKMVKNMFNLDTRSAVTAAVVVSVITLLGAFFVDLCSYVYWSAYFTRFRIPLSYLEEAIIPENGLKYTVVLIIPAVIFVWWLMNSAVNGVIKLYTKIGEKRRAKRPTENKSGKAENALRFFGWMVALLLCFAAFVMVFSNVGNLKDRWVKIALICEAAIFILWKASKGFFGHLFKASKKAYILVRIVAVLLLAYVVLGGVFYSGSLDNYGGNYGQTLKIVNDPPVNTLQLTEGDETTAQLVLLETTDYYYVTDADLKKADGMLCVSVWDKKDTYRFIEKTDRPIKTVYASLYVGRNSDSSLSDKLLVPYIIGTPILGVLFMGLLSIPKRQDPDDDAETETEDTENENTIE